ncbi:MAG: fibronectin type III domain-containing protein, partial [Actinomycetota bacterium]|nr:fibronectin type III domain-containing protein [Actinomycetota bacterium]
GSYTFGGLSNGVAYQFEVVATNAVGNGPAGSSTATPNVPAGYQRLDARVSCPGFTVTNPNAFPVSYEWVAGGVQGFGVVEAGQTEPVVGADASSRRTTLILKTSVRPVDDRVTGRC